MQISDVKPIMLSKQPVRYQNISYYITGCTLRLRDGEFYYQAELHDINANSVTIAELEDVILQEDKL